MAAFTEFFGRLAVTLRVALAATALLSIATPSWAGPILTVTIGQGGKFHPGSKKDPHEIWGSATDPGRVIAGPNLFQILKGHLMFDSDLAFGGHRTFYPHGQQLLLYGWLDTDKDGGAPDRKDFQGVMIAAKLLNYRFLERNGKTFFLANVLEIINPRLAALLGLRKTTYDATLELQLLQIKKGKQVYDMIEGGILTTGAIPEPSSIVLLGLPLVWFGAKRWLGRRPLNATLPLA